MRCLLALLVFGCETAPVTRLAPVEAPEPRALSVQDLFPTGVGDRWRERAATGVRNRGVTAHSASGLRVFFAQGDTRPTFYRVDADQVALASPDGEAITPMLRSPIRQGASWTYADSAPCTATWRTTGASRGVAGITLEDCATVEHVCEHPVGGPFTTPTRRTTTETFCPGVGRVSSRTTLVPPLAGSSGPTAVEVVYWRVGGSPIARRPEPLDCDGLLLLSSDMHAACGTEWRWSGEESLERGCVHRFEREGGTAEIRVTEHGEGAPAALAALLAERGEAPGGSFTAERHEGFVLALATSEAGACAHPRRLFPVLRSIVSQ